MADIKSEEVGEKKSLNFIEQIVEKDLKEGKNGGKVQTRFPPEPNGYLHIGHAKAICLDFGIAADHNGICNLRFDDTNPTKEDVEYVEAIKEDIQWLGYQWGNEYYASDYFQQLWDFAIRLIEEGKAYIDEQTSEQIAQQKGTPTQPGVESPYRNRPIEESLSLFKKMNTGEIAEGAMVLRAKIDMANPNMHFRDPIMYRIIKHPHHRTGTKWNVYPMYDFAHPLSDYKEGVTHSLCSLEFENHRPLYDWFLRELGFKNVPRQIEFARLNLNYCLTSKRKCLALVNEHIVDGWDDPRMATISGMRLRGYPAKAIRTFSEKIGVSKAYSVVSMDLLESCVRDELNENAPRAMAVLDPLKVVIDNYPEGKTEEIEVEVHPNHPEMGTRKVLFGRELFVEREDFMAEPVKKYFRLFPGNEVRFKSAYFVKCVGFDCDENGEVTTVHCTYDPESRGGNSPDGRKVKGTIHWVSAEGSFKANVNMYDRLFNVPNPSDESTGSFKDNLNPDSLKVLTGCLIESGLKDVKPGDVFQFMRKGYFCVDKNSTCDNIIFNLTVPLNSSWGK